MKHPLMKRSLVQGPLCVGLMLLGLVGCAHRSSTETTQVQVLPSGSFEQVWTVTPNLDGRIEQLTVSGDHFFVSSSAKQLMVLSPIGSVQAIVNLRGLDGIRPPEAQADRFIVPSAGTLEIYNYAGLLKKSIKTDYPVSSPVVAVGDRVLAGLHSEEGGRVGAMSLTRNYSTTEWSLLMGEVTQRPAVYENVVYFSTLGGKVVALAPENHYVHFPKAPEMPDQVFKADGRIECSIRVDEGGVYVPATDTKLYVLDPVNGRIRWEYFAGEPLMKSVTATTDTVYLPVNAGVVALIKKSPERYRKPLWTANGIAYVVTDDAKLTYALSRAGQVVALDKTTGQTRFTSTRSDIKALYKSPEKELTLIALTNSGTVIALRPVTVAGKAGQLVLAPVTPSRAM